MPLRAWHTTTGLKLVALGGPLGDTLRLPYCRLSLLEGPQEVSNYSRLLSDAAADVTTPPSQPDLTSMGSTDRGGRTTTDDDGEMPRFTSLWPTGSV